MKFLSDIDGANRLIEDSNNRLVSDVEKSNWNAAKIHADSTHAPATAQKNSDITKAEIEAKLIGTITSHNHTIQPTGAIIMWSGQVVSIPAGWKLCNGEMLNPTTFPDLFNVVGVSFGGNGSTTFALPNLQDRFIVGAGSSYTVGANGGEKEHTLTVTEMPAHTHKSKAGVDSGDQQSPTTNYPAFNPNAYCMPEDATGFTMPTEITGGGTPHENRPPYFALCYIIKC